MTKAELRAIYLKTRGHCHFCGDPVVFELRGWAQELNGHWEVDHVIQRDKGGASGLENCLPACTRCNRLRWHRTGAEIRDLLYLGVIAIREIEKKTIIGLQLDRLREARLAQNAGRRAMRARAAAL